MVIRGSELPPREPEKPYPVSPRKFAKWKRVVAWIAGIVLTILLFAAIGIYALLHSASFHNYVLRTAEKKASESLNTRVQLHTLSLHLSPLGLDLYGLTVSGVGPGANAPLLQVDHVGAEVRIISALHRQWSLDNVTVDHPVVNLIVNSDGHNNLPISQSSGNSETNVFDLAIRHIVLDRGEVYYNDRKSALRADLRDLKFQTNYDMAGGGRYIGALSYRDGHLQYGSYLPMPHDLLAQFDARRTGMTLSNLSLKSGQSQLLLNASLDNYTSPNIHAKYAIILATADLTRVLENPSLPSGVVLVNGSADYASVPGRSLLETATLEGSIRSTVLRLRTPTSRTDIRDVNAYYRLSKGDVELRNIDARLLGGQLRGTATIRDLSGKQRGHIAVALHNLSLAELKTVANSAALNSVSISGHVDANSEASWTGSISNLVARADAMADGSIASAQPNRNITTLPLNAEIHARYKGQAQELSLNQSYLRTPQSLVNLSGTVSNRSALEVSVQSNDLHELETIADIFGSSAAQPLDLHGTASFDGTVRGSTAAPQIAGQLNAGNLQIRGSAFRVVRTGVQANPSLISLQNGVLDLAKQGHVTFNVQSGLHDWSHTPSSPFAVTLNATQVSVAELARAANLTTPVSGTLSANIEAHGTQLNPVGQGDCNLRDATVSGEPIQMATVRFQGTADAAHANLLVRSSAGTAQGQLTYYPRQEGYDAQLQAIDIHLERLQTLRERNMRVTGTLDLTASGRGTLKDPQGKASLTIPQLDIQKQQIRNVNLQVEVTNQQATFALASQVVSTPLRAQGKVALTGDYYADASLDTPVIPLQPLLAAYSPAQAARISGQTEIHAAVRGPLKNKALLEAHLNIPTLGVSVKTGATASAQAGSVDIAAVTPIRADYADGVVSLQPGEIKGTDTDVHFQGRLPLKSDAPSTVSVQGAIDLSLAQAFDPTLTTTGQIQFDINAAGHNANENVEGQIRIVNASFATPDAPVGLSNGNGVLTLRRDRVDITQFSGSVGGGQVTASGGVAYRPAIHFNIGLKGNGLRLLYPESVRTNLDLNLAMTGTTDAALLQGQINVNSVSFTPDFDLSDFASQFSAISSPPPTQGFADNLKVNVSLRSTSELNVVSPTLSVQGNANLRVIGTGANPVIVGRTNLTGGDLIFLGNRYLVQGGTIAFVNTTQTEPIVNLQASTTIQQYNIALRFLGPVDRLRTNYTSDPSLPPADIIHLLAFGQTEEAANAAPAQSSTLGAESLVASQVSSQVTGRLQKAFGVSQISLDPQLGATTGNQQQGARITVRQRVTSKLFVTFSTDVTTTQYSAVQMQYQINRKWSVSGVRNQNGGFGLDGRYHKDF